MPGSDYIILASFRNGPVVASIKDICDNALKREHDLRDVPVIRRRRHMLVVDIFKLGRTNSDFFLSGPCEVS